MTDAHLEYLRYPIGKYEAPSTINSGHLREWIDTLERFPADLTELVQDLDDEQLDTPYRPDGWTIRQVIHHLADSHINSYVRFRWALTEKNPTIKAYDEKRWAELPDARSEPVAFSLDIIRAVHARWVILLKSLSADDFKRTFVHPENGKTIRLDWNTGMYAWHSRHHYAHVERVIRRNAWNEMVV